jgi:hypothetical protein
MHNKVAALGLDFVNKFSPPAAFSWLVFCRE